MDNRCNRRLQRILLIGMGAICIGWWTVTETKKYLGYEFVSLLAAEKRWGTVPFSVVPWKGGNEKSRASMTVDLVRSGLYIGKTVEEVRNDLGE